MKYILIIVLIILSSCTNKTSFWDYKCTQDCSWHIAGYNWAKKKSIEEPIDCWWKSNSFIEWCVQYTKDIR